MHEHKVPSWAKIINTKLMVEDSLPPLRSPTIAEDKYSWPGAITSKDTLE